MPIRATDEEKLAALALEVDNKHHQLSLAKQLLHDIRRQRSACHAQFADLSAATQRHIEESDHRLPAPVSSATADAWISRDEVRLLGEREVLIQALERVQNRKQVTEQQLRIQFARQAALDSEIREAQARCAKTRARTSAAYHKVRLLEQTLKQREDESKAAVSKLTECERRLRIVQENGKRAVADAVKWTEAKRVQRAECMALASAEEKLHLELQLLQRLNRRLIDWIEQQQDLRRKSNATAVAAERDGDDAVVGAVPCSISGADGASEAVVDGEDSASTARRPQGAHNNAHSGGTTSKLFDAHRHVVDRILVQTALQQLH